MQPDTIINLVAGGALAAFLARLLQQQYEARLNDFKDRIREQSTLLADMTKGFDLLHDRLATMATELKDVSDELAALKSTQRPARGG